MEREFHHCIFCNKYVSTVAYSQYLRKCSDEDHYYQIYQTRDLLIIVLSVDKLINGKLVKAIFDFKNKELYFTSDKKNTKIEENILPWFDPNWDNIPELIAKVKTYILFA